MKNKQIIQIVVMVIFLNSLFNIYLNAAKYYVSTTGDNNADGVTASTAWATLDHAITIATNMGESIIILAGEHGVNSTISFPEGVSLMGEVNTSIISSSVTGDWVFLFRFHSDNEGADGSQSISHLRINGNNTTFAAIDISARSNVKVHDCEFLDFTDSGIMLNIGPTGEGEVPHPSINCLKAIGEWLSVNGDAIYGTIPWEISHEGSANLNFNSTEDRAEKGFTNILQRTISGLQKKKIAFMLFHRENQMKKLP